jgi:hypothetical protein
MSPSQQRGLTAVDCSHLAKESPRNDGRMKDASEEPLVLAEDLAEQFFGEQLRKTFDWKNAKDALQFEGALAP